MKVQTFVGECIKKDEYYPYFGIFSGKNQQ